MFRFQRNTNIKEYECPKTSFPQRCPRWLTKLKKSALHREPSMWWCLQSYVFFRSLLLRTHDQMYFTLFHPVWGAPDFAKGRTLRHPRLMGCPCQEPTPTATQACYHTARRTPPFLEAKAACFISELVRKQTAKPITLAV